MLFFLEIKMVISLFDICRLKLRDGLTKGMFSNVHVLPPDLRQSILDSVLMHGDIDNPNSRSILNSKEFLTDMTSLDIQSGKIDDSKYLAIVAKSLSTKLPNGQTIGSRITELKLNYFDSIYEIDFDIFEFPVNLKSFLRLIGQCPNLKKLHLKLIEDIEYDDVDTRWKATLTNICNCADRYWKI